MSKIMIIGAGMMGSALSVPAADNAHDIHVVGTPLDREIIDYARAHGAHLTMKRQLPKLNQYYQFEEIERALNMADIVICGVSSFGVDWFVHSALPLIPASAPILMVTKGLVLNGDALESFPKHILRATGRRVYAVGGPCTSYELADRRVSSVAFCGYDIDVLRTLKSALQTEYYHISLSTDVEGVECAVALKNAYALAVSMAVGMIEREDGAGCALAYNPQAAIFAQSLREMRKLIALIGARPDNIVYAAGDLYVTVFGGRTRLLGTLLGRGLSFNEAKAELSGVTLESVAITMRVSQAVRALSSRRVLDMTDFPLLMYVSGLIAGDKDTGMPWRAFETETII